MPSSSEKAAVIDASKISSTPLVGSNQASTVSLLSGKLNQVMGSAGELRAFAKEQFDASTPAAQKANADAANASSPLYPKEEGRWKPKASDGDRALLARAVASSQVDQMIGLNSLAEERFGVDAQGRNIGISLEVDGAQIESQWTPVAGQAKKTCALEVDYRDPRIQKGLSDLEVSDYITGQIDRHNGNIMVDPSTGKVKGIDNDLAFPAVDREVMLDNDKILQCKAVAGLPRQVSVETARKVLAVSPEKMEQTLRNMPVPPGCDALSDASIQGARDRLEKLQSALRDPEASGIELVDEFNDKTYVRAMAVQNVKAVESQTFSEGQAMPSFAAKVGGARTAPKTPATAAEESAMLDLALDLARTAKTSYLGGVALQQQRNDIMMVVSPNTNGIRPKESAVNAVRNATFIKAELQSLADEKLKLTEKLKGYQDRLQKLDDPGVGIRLRALRYGGVDGAKDAFSAKETAVLARLQEIDKQFEKLQPAAAKMGLTMPTAYTQDQKHDYQQQLKEVMKQLPALHKQVEDLKQQCTQGINHGAISDQDMEKILKRADIKLAENDNEYGVANSSESSTIAFKELAKDSANNVRMDSTRNDLNQVERALIAKHALPAIDREIEGIHRQMDALRLGDMNPKKLADLTQQLKDAQTDLGLQKARVDNLCEPALSVGERLKSANQQLKSDQEKIEADEKKQEAKQGVKTKDAMKPKGISFAEGVNDDPGPKVKMRQ